MLRKTGLNVRISSYSIKCVSVNDPKRSGKFDLMEDKYTICITGDHPEQCFVKSTRLEMKFNSIIGDYKFFLS